MIRGNILFVLGSPCSGKSTISKLLAEKYNMYYFSGDNKRFEYYRDAKIDLHPYMTKNGANFFDWSLEEMIDWERGVIAEQTPYILQDLNEYANSNRWVLYEGMLDMDYVKDIIPKDRVVFLKVDKKISEDTFFEREDHKPLLNSILETPGISDDEKLRRISIRKKAAIEAFQIDISEYDITTFDRTQFTVEEMLEKVEGCFNINKDNCKC
jgi:adenylate kinase family enzyme